MPRLGDETRVDADAPTSPKTPPSAFDRYRKLGLRLMVLGAAMLVTVLAAQQLRTQGTDVRGPLTVADHKARAKVEDRPAPGFRLPALEGRGTIGLEDYPGKVVILNFWASWCAPCRAEAPDLQATWEAYRGRGIQFLGVDYRDDRAAARAFVEEFGITFPSVYDPAGKLAFDYELVGLPTTFIVTPDRRIVYQFIGKVDGAVLGDAIEDVLGAEGL